MARRSLSTSLGTGSNSSAHAPRCSVALRASSTSTCRGTSSVCPPCGSAAALPPIHRTSHVSSCVVQVTSRCNRREVRTSLISGQATSRWSGWPMRCVPTRSWRSSRSLRIRSPSKASPLARPTPPRASPAHAERSVFARLAGAAVLAKVLARAHGALRRLDLSGNPLHDHGVLLILSGAPIDPPIHPPTHPPTHPSIHPISIMAQARSARVSARPRWRILRFAALGFAPVRRVLPCRHTRRHACKRWRRTGGHPAGELRAFTHWHCAVCMDGQRLGRGRSAARARLLESAAVVHRADAGTAQSATLRVHSAPRGLLGARIGTHNPHSQRYTTQLYHRGLCGALKVLPQSQEVRVPSVIS